jgi:hypothetical protein
MNFLSNWFDKVLIPEWRKSMKMLSVQWGAICIAAAPIWSALSDEQKASLLGILGISPAWYVAVAVVISIVLRLKAQGIGEAEK